MKKSILVISVIWLLCICFAISASAIDTPWIPISPDESTTESSSPTNEKTDTTDAENDEESVADTKNDEVTKSEDLPAETDGKSDPNSRESDSENSELPMETGCGSTIVGCAVLVACLVSSVCVIQMRKENE